MTRFRFRFRFLAAFALVVAFAVQKSWSNNIERKQLSSHGYLCSTSCIWTTNYFTFPFSPYHECTTYFLTEDYVDTTENQHRHISMIPKRDYCSPKENHDYFGRQCNGTCGFQGYSYQRCWTMDGSWGYCGTAVNATKLDRQLTTYGDTCQGPCDTVVGNGTMTGTVCDSFDKFCSIYDGYSVMGSKCENECAQRGYNYFWCNTVGSNGLELELGLKSWDYCSPSSFKKFGNNF